MILVDSDVIFDLLDNDPQWCGWSGAQLQRWAQLDQMTVNAIVYAEISPRYRSEAKVDELLKELKLDFAEIPRSAAFLAKVEREQAPFPIFSSAHTQQFWVAQSLLAIRAATQLISPPCPSSRPQSRSRSTFAMKMTNRRSLS